jgi:hypothetical protein
MKPQGLGFLLPLIIGVLGEQDRLAHRSGAMPISLTCSNDRYPPRTVVIWAQHVGLPGP